MHKVSVALEVQEQLLFDIMTTAVEGGINYWAYSLSVSREANLDVFAFSCKANGVYSRLDVDASKVLTGIQRVLSPGFSVRRDIREALTLSLAENDASNIDAEAADVIIQAALFGEITYS